MTVKLRDSARSGKCHFLPGGGLPKIGVQVLFLDQKGDHLYFLKETKYFVKHFRFQRKRLSDATRGQKLQRDLLFNSM